MSQSLHEVYLGVSYVQIGAANIVEVLCESLACNRVQKRKEITRSAQEEANVIAVSKEMTGLEPTPYIM